MALKNRYFAFILLLTMLFLSIGAMTASTPSSTWSTTISIINGATSALEATSTYAKNFEVVNAFIQATGASFGIPTIFKATFEEEMAKSGYSQQETLEKVNQFLINVGDLLYNLASKGSGVIFIIVLPEGQTASLADAYQNLANAYQTDIDKDQHDDLETPLLPQPTSDTSSNEGSGVSDIGEPLIGDNNFKAPTEAEFPNPYDPDLPCI